MKHHPFNIVYYVVLGMLLVAPGAEMLAQRHVVCREGIASLQVVAGQNWQSMPITSVDGDPIHISFDDMTHDYRRYVYRIEHCEADWTITQGLFESDYLEGFNGVGRIETSGQSLNTNHLYTHYSLCIPNDDCRITMSGNYRLSVYDEENGDDNPVLVAYFMVVDPKMNVSIEVSSNTDIDNNGCHQQVALSVEYGGLKVSNPSAQVKTVVLQNGRWDNAVWNASPDYQRMGGLEWRHKRELIFDGGNEYRKFEMLDLHHTTMGIESMQWDGTDYHAYLFADEPRQSYVYDESANGAFYIRNSDNVDNDVISDYAWVHFLLETERQIGDIYLNGNWTYDTFLPQWKMIYDEENHRYHAAVLLKQGYYSYQYVVLKSDGTTSPVATEGNFFQTENQYQALVYYRGAGERTDRLVGYQELTFR